MAHDTVRRCRLRTERLIAGDWHDLADDYGLDLIEVVSSILTAATTTALPAEWHGDFDSERARQWVEARYAESPTLLVLEHETDQAVGLLILFEVPGDSHLLDLRLGYILAESAWGLGFASELVGGMVEWARSEPSIESVSGGVARANNASARVLLKHGFEPTSVGDEEQLYRLVVRPRKPGSVSSTGATITK